MIPFVPHGMLHVDRSSGYGGNYGKVDGEFYNARHLRAFLATLPIDGVTVRLVDELDMWHVIIDLGRHDGQEYRMLKAISRRTMEDELAVQVEASYMQRQIMEELDKWNAQPTLSS